MNENLLSAIRLLGAATNGSFDIWALAGPAGKPARQQVLTALTGSPKRLPIAKCGVTAITAEFRKQMPMEGNCLAIRERNFVAACKRLTGAAEPAEAS